MRYYDARMYLAVQFKAPLSSQMPPKKCKVVLLGNSGVGKTQLVRSILNQNTEHNLKPTIGVEFNPKVFPLENVELQFWDTGGQEKYRSIAKVNYRSSNVFILVYDITSRESFEGVNSWLSDIDEATDTENIVKILCGNKTDLRYERRVEEKEGREMAGRKGMLWIQTSALRDENVSNLLELLFKELREREKATIVPELMDIRSEGRRREELKETPPPPKKCCQSS